MHIHKEQQCGDRVQMQRQKRRSPSSFNMPAKLLTSTLGTENRTLLPVKKMTGDDRGTRRSQIKQAEEETRSTENGPYLWPGGPKRLVRRLVHLRQTLKNRPDNHDAVCTQQSLRHACYRVHGQHTQRTPTHPKQISPPVVVSTVPPVTLKVALRLSSL